MKIKETERLSIRPFGRMSTKAAFVMDVDKVPFYNIPDLTGFDVSSPSFFMTFRLFQLQPYVSVLTPKIEESKREERKVDLTPELLEEIEEMIKNSPQGLVVDAP